MRACLKRSDPAKYRLARGAWSKRRDRWAFHRHIDAITPYGEWAIPAYVVMCESGGDYTQWNLGSTSPDRASGAYQIIGPTWRGYGGLEYASKAAYAPAWAQHIVASRISNGGTSTSQWDCA